MSKLAHSDEDGMAVIEARKYIRNEMPTALTLIKFIAAGDGKLKGHECYLTKLQIIHLCKTWLERRTIAVSSPTPSSQAGDDK